MGGSYSLYGYDDGRAHVHGTFWLDLWGHHYTNLISLQDRVYCEEQRKLKIFPLTMGLFREYILYAHVPNTLASQPLPTMVLDVLVNEVLFQIELERKGNLIDKYLIRNCMYMLEGLYETDQEEESSKLYLTKFEPNFITNTSTHYREEGQRLLKTLDAGSFCRHVQRRLEEEERRCVSTLPKATIDGIRRVIDEELIRKNIKEVINLPGSGVEFMLDNNRVNELKDIYELISRVDNKKEALKIAVQKRIVELGMEVNRAAQAISKEQPTKQDGDGKTMERPVNQQTVAAIEWVDDVLKLKDRYDVVLIQAFREDKGLQIAFTVSFTEFINAFDRSSEYLSLFFDENMKKGIKGKTESEIDALVDKGIVLLRYIQDKDLFERYYKRHLARRLILKKTASLDAEKQVLVRMKMEIGNALTSRIEPMFKDIDISEDLTNGFKKYQKELGEVVKKASELEIHVLTNTMWPLEGLTSVQDADNLQCIWPLDLDKLKSSFERFYLNKHNGRKLTWPAQMGSVDIRAYFPQAKTSAKMRELNCSTYAAMILLLFNDLPDSTALSCSEIQARTRIPQGDLVRNLQALAVAPKTRILLKDPMSRDIKVEDKFTFNSAFSSNFQKIKIGVVAANKVETVVEKQETEKKNDDSRGLVIEAAIVRTMKQRRMLSHAELMTEIIQQLMSRFKPDLPMVKKKIESLIEREYLERVEDAEKPTYTYLA